MADEPPQPRLRHLCALCGALGVRVIDDAALDDTLDDTLESALAHPGPALVEVITDPDPV